MALLKLSILTSPISLLRYLKWVFWSRPCLFSSKKFEFNQSLPARAIQWRCCFNSSGEIKKIRPPGGQFDELLNYVIGSVKICTKG